MEGAFLLDDEARARFLQFVMQSFSCTYICLWSYLPQPSNCLFFKDGLYREETNQPSSSSGFILARRLFDEYRNSIIIIGNDCVPGLAFKNSLSYLDLKEKDLKRLASSETQRLFYQEASIKTATFMGCKSGEIEIGFSNVTQINMEMKLRSWFLGDITRSLSPLSEAFQPPSEQNMPNSSSSSSLRTLSTMESPERSSLLFNINPSTSYMPETPIEQTVVMKPISTTSTSTSSHQAALSLTQIRNRQFPNTEIEDAAMTRAILAVISSSSPSSSSSSHQPNQQNLVPRNNPINREASAFKNYDTSFFSPLTAQMKPNLSGRQSMLKRAIDYFKSLNSMRIHEQVQGNRPIGNLHHMLSERKRREKLNESFQALRALLPPGSKKHKVSILTSTREYLTSLKAQVSEISRRNQLLEAQLLPAAREAPQEVTTHERLDVHLIRNPQAASTSTSEETIADLRVTVRGDCCMLDLAICLLEFLKSVKNVSLMSMEADTQLAESTSIYRLTLRLNIQGSEWDESAFLEAVKRVVAELTL